VSILHSPGENPKTIKPFFKKIDFKNLKFQEQSGNSKYHYQQSNFPPSQIAHI